MNGGVRIQAYMVDCKCLKKVLAAFEARYE